MAAPGRHLVRVVRYSFYTLVSSRTVHLVAGVILFSSLLPVAAGSKASWSTVVGLGGGYTVNPTSLYWVAALLLGYRLFSDERDTGMLLVVLSKPVTAWELVVGRIAAAYTVLLAAYTAASMLGALSSLTHGLPVEWWKTLAYPLLMATLSMPLLLLTSLGGLARGSGLSLQLGVGGYVASRIVGVTIAVRGMLCDVEEVLNTSITSLRDIVAVSLTAIARVDALNPFTNPPVAAYTLLGGEAPAPVAVARPPLEAVAHGVALNAATALALLALHIAVMRRGF